MLAAWVQFAPSLVGRPYSGLVQGVCYGSGGVWEAPTRGCRAYSASPTKVSRLLALLIVQILAPHPPTPTGFVASDRPGFISDQSCDCDRKRSSDCKSWFKIGYHHSSPLILIMNHWQCVNTYAHSSLPQIFISMAYCRTVVTPVR